MNAILVLGRILFVLVFILSGAQKLMDIPATASTIGSKVVLPDVLTAYTPQLEAATGMTTPTLMAILAGVVEIGAALMIAANIGARAGAVLLILFTMAATWYFHSFWTMSGPERDANMIQALKNLSLIGGLLVIFAIGRWRPGIDRYPEPAIERL
ncbi:DoxX family protein [Pseudorhodoplanes sp.]|uniref:DoxX family protein n=1 Tax=Pseudorhodoplanes sp. TaxID=1934341 RepID=UPI002C7AB803|nr:DoxX family protein [Pseudorhodoplanes sp.]HWV53999.1 DoxX family protein [Pseudorhodoplanes sp.]